MSDKGDWYCRNCGYLSGGRVTFAETCDQCHIPVEWHSVEDMTRIEELELENASLKNGIAFWNRVDHDKLEYFEGRIKELEGENAELKDKDDLYERDCRIEILSDALRRIRSYQDSDTVSSEEEALAEIFLICEECDV